MHPPREARPPARPWAHWLALAFFGAVLVLLGQFQEAIFVELTRGWNAVGALVGWAGLITAPGLRSMPASATYHLAYTAATAAALHLLLRGRGTPWVLGGFGAVLAAGLGLLAWGHAAHWPGATERGHLLISVVSSPLALLAGYALALLGQPVGAPSRP
ncbi:MAG: XrtX-associated membrane protein [Janthinobacterium lividum]